MTNTLVSIDIERRTRKLSKNHNVFEDCFDQIVSLDNLEKAYNKTQLTDTKFNSESISFSFNLMHNLKKIQKGLIENTYKPKGYNIFKVYEPKERTIAAPKFKDKIIQFAIHNVLNDDFERKFIKDSYACQKNKGTHKCSKRIKYFLAKGKWQWGDSAWIVKADIKKFFYLIDHDILKNILRKEIKCKRTLKLLFKIIDHSVDPVGLPLGNVTSQLLANIYLNQLDQSCKRKLSLKYYIRYMDDFCVIVENKERAKIIKEKMSNFVRNKLNLRFNKNKSKIFPIAQGLNMVGYKIHPTHMLLRKRSKERMKQKIKKFKDLLIKNKITDAKVKQILNSWKGHAEHACAYNFMNYLDERFDYIYLENDKFEVNLEEVYQ